MKLYEFILFFVKGMKLFENFENMLFMSVNLIDGCIVLKVKILFFKKGIK